MQSSVGIKKRLTRGVIIPVVLCLAIFGTIKVVILGMNIKNSTETDLQNKSEAAAYQVSEFFTQYLTVAKQMANNESIMQMMRDMKNPGDGLKVASYDAAENSLNAISDSDDILRFG